MPHGKKKKTGEAKYSGLEVVKAVRKYRAKTPIICYSVAIHSNIEISRKLIELGVNEIISKPIRPSLLLERVKFILHLSKQEPQSEMILNEIESRKIELNSDAAFTRIRAVWALGELGHFDPVVVSLLEKIAKNDKDKFVKEAANEAVVKINQRLKSDIA